MSRARLEDMAAIVVQTGLTPADYWALTVAEHAAIVKAINRRNRRR